MRLLWVTRENSWVKTRIVFFAQFQERVDASGAGYERNYWIATATKKHLTFQKCMKVKKKKKKKNLIKIFYERDECCRVNGRRKQISFGDIWLYFLVSEEIYYLISSVTKYKVLHTQRNATQKLGAIYPVLFFVFTTA
jgi:hypothetical protein